MKMPVQKEVTLGKAGLCSVIVPGWGDRPRVICRLTNSYREAGSLGFYMGTFIFKR